MKTTFRNRVLASTAILAFVMAATVAPAGAHDPIFVTEDQTTPETGPYLPDGTISFAIYGSLLAPDDTRGLEFDLRDGDDLYVQLLIPDLEPEISLDDADLPFVILTTPAGDEREIRPETREPFSDPFSGTAYLVLHEELEEAVVGGRYQVVVTGAAATRFVVAIGQSEQFFTPTERTGDRPTTFQGIAEPLGLWYSTPVGAEATVDSENTGVDIDVELIEEELDALAEAEVEMADDDTVDTEADTDTPDTDTVEAADSTTTSVAEEPEAVAAPIAAGDDGDDSEGGLGWVVPVVIVVAIAAGAVLLLRRGRTG